MVGISPGPSDPLRPHLSLLDEEENEVDEWDGCGEVEFNSDMVGIESFDDEFRPVERPAEPVDEDRPVNWPMPECSFLSVSGAALLEDQGIWKEPIGRSFQKRLEPLVTNENSISFQEKDEGIWKDWFSRSFRKRIETLVTNDESTSFRAKDESIWKDWFARSFRKRTEPLVTKEDGNEVQPPVRATHKRHHTLIQDPTTLPSSRSHQANIFEVFQQCKEFKL